MAKFSSLADNVKLECLGADNPDASDGILYQANANNRIEANINQRTLLIGLGGQGIRTLNIIKKNVQAKFKNWDSRIAFLAIDADGDDLNRMASLDSSEKHCIETDASTGERYNDPKNRSSFTKSWLYPDFHTDFSVPGANQIRQACMAKLFDEREASNHNDNKVMSAITAAANKVTTRFVPSATNRFTVHVIAGISGGTGSGSIVHVAHLVRRAIGVEHKVYGYLLLPDVVEQFLQGGAALKNLYVNGYAALKELNYFYSMNQRSGFDTFETSDPAQGKMNFDYNHPLYDMIYLVNGSNGTAVPNKNKAAMDTLSDSILNLLSESQNANANLGDANGQLTSSFLANAQAARDAKLPELYETDEAVKGQEKGTFDCGEDVFNYNALGVASATIPEHTVKCYSVTKIMRTLFGRPDGFDAPASFHGFSMTALPSQQGELEARKLLAYSPQVVEQKILDLCNAALQWPEDFEPLDHSDILAGAESNLRMQLNIEAKKNKVMQALRDYMGKAYAAYKTALEAFLTDYGPRPYVQMYDGYDAANIAYTNSLRKYLSDYKGFNTVNGLTRIRPIVSAQEKDAAYSRLQTPLLGKSKDRISAWHEAYRMNEVMKMAEYIAGFVFGEAGIYRTEYLKLVENASAAVREFDLVLDRLSGVYENMGAKFDTHRTFLEAAVNESATNVNIIREEEDYVWAKDIVDTRARRLNYSIIKGEIIKSFMDDPDGWTEYDKTKPFASPRRMLDKIMAPYVDTGDDLTMVSYINYKLALGGDPQAVVNKLVEDMSVSAIPLFNAHPNANAVRGSGVAYLMVPRAMFLQQGGAAIRACFDAACKNMHIQLFPSDMSDKMVFYKLYSAVPLYALRDLKMWENYYDAAERTKLHMNESGKGDFDPATSLAWEDYPALALERDPRQPDRNGVISREGKFLKNKLDPLFEECLANGIIERKQDTNGGYYYACYVLDQPGWDLSLDLHEYNRKDKEGLYLIGAPVFEYLAEKNGDTVETIYRTVSLRDQGIFNAPTEDANRALDRAKRALRRNVPLYRGLKKTLAVWKKLGSALLEANAEIQAGMISKYIPYYIATGILAPNAKKLWTLNDYPRDGQSVEICSLNPLKLDEDDPFVQENCLYELLCRAFIEKMTGDKNVSSFYEENYNMMVEEPEIYAKEFLKRLDVFKADADAFTEKVKSPSLTVQKSLYRALKLDEDALEEMKDHYARFLSLYKKIAAACSEE